MSLKHALITEIQLGKSVKEVSNEIKLDFTKSEIIAGLERVIRELIRLNKPHVRFHVSIGGERCDVGILDKSWPEDLWWDYWNYEYNDSNDDDAYYDCEKLNELVQMLFGVKHTSKKPTISQKDYIRKKRKVCPFCSSKDISSLDHFSTYITKTKLACRSCDHEWEEHYKMVLTKFKSLG